MTFVLEVTKKPIGLPIFPFSSFRPVNFHFWAEVAELYDVWCIYWLDLPPHPVTVTLFFPFSIIMQHVDPLPESSLLLQISSLRVPLQTFIYRWHPGVGGCSRSNFFESQKPAFLPHFHPIGFEDLLLLGTWRSMTDPWKNLRKTWFTYLFLYITSWHI